MPTSPTFDLIRTTVERRRVVHAVYASLPRSLCPHVLGHARDGRELALFFQFAGESRRGFAPGGDWRCMPLDKLSITAIEDGRWRTKENYNVLGQRCVVYVVCAVPDDSGPLR